MSDQIAQIADGAEEREATADGSSARSASAVRPLSLMTIVMAAASVAVLLLFFRRRWHTLPAVPPRPQVLAPGMSFMLFLAFQLLAIGSIPVTMAISGIDVQADANAAQTLTLADNAKLALGRVVAQIAAIIVFVRLCRAAGPGPFQRPGHLRAAAIGAAAILLAWPLSYTAATAAGSIWSLVSREPVEQVAHDTLKLMVASDIGGSFLLLAVCVVVAAPIIEEIMYRGLIQDMFRRLGLPAWPAIVTTSLLFASMHLGNARPHAIAALFVLSLGFGWAYARTGRLAAPIAMHVIFNGGNLALAVLGRG